MAKRKRAYSELFDAAHGSDSVAVYGHERAYSLADSRIGASLWTAEEKGRFFSAVARYGCDDLPAMARILETKSQLEVGVYLRELEAGREHEAERSSRRVYFSRADVQVAYEVSEECGLGLDHAADALAIECEQRDAAAEKRKYGDGWLVDAERATAIDTLIDGTQDCEKDADGSDVEREQIEQDQSPSNQLTPAASFFDTTTLLQLSRSLFMNGPAVGPWNYRTADLLEHRSHHYLSDSAPRSDQDEDVQSFAEPAIYQSALDDLHSLVKDVTQKIVHAILFQATSRLRAKDDDSPAPVVITSDVHTAIDVLGLNLDWKSYWAKLPRRAGLELYSESEKYKRGRTGTKNGVKLTYDEVEAELGLSKSSTRWERGRNTQPDRLHNDSNVEDDSGDDLNSESEEDSEVSSDGILEVKDERENRKRKRDLSPDSFARAEERHMRALDEKADREEDVRLRGLLGLALGDGGGGEDAEIPERPKLNKRFRGANGSRIWREDLKVTRIAAWEVEYLKKLKVEQEESESDEGSTSESERESTDLDVDHSAGHEEAGADGNGPMSSSSKDEMEDAD